MDFWYRRFKSWQAFLLLPLAWVFQWLVALRQFLYRHQWIKSTRFSVPIIVVGNLTVGGTGKTPLVIWLVHFLKSKGFRPGVVSRGFGKIKQKQPVWVTLETTPEEVGDEACLIAKRTASPVVVCTHRAAAVHYLLKHTDCNIVISDDGLQHYRLARDIEIAVIDAERQLGNRCFLPAGPLRESPSRLKKVDFVIRHGDTQQGMLTMQLVGDNLLSVTDHRSKIVLSEFTHKIVHAVAGIGHPARFFTSLKKKGLEIIEHIFPDHYHYCAKDFQFPDNFPILMTEKDAIKCKSFADERFWYLPVDVEVDKAFQVALLAKLSGI